MSKNVNKFISALLAALISVSTVLPIIATEISDETSETTEITVITPFDDVASEPKEPSYEYRIEGLGNVTAATVKNLGMSAKYYNFSTDEKGVKQSAHVVVGDVLRGAVLRGASLGSDFGKRGKVSSLSGDSESDERLLAAVNADFFSTQTGVPMGVYVSDGRYISSSYGLCAAGVNADGSVVFGTVGDSVSIICGEKTYEVHYFNKFPTVYGAYLLTRDFGESTRLEPSITATEYIIAYEGEPRLGESFFGEVKEIRNSTGKGEIPEGAAVLCVPDLYAYSELYRDIEVGDRLEIKVAVNEEFRSVVSAVGGGDVILRDGEITDTLEDDAIETARNPRTALGVTADGSFVLFVVDGRKSGYSSGVKLTALAAAMKELGCTDAINLDGGGSSVMVLFGGGGIVNRPSDGVERSVPNAFALYESREAADVLHTLSLTAHETLLYRGAKLPLSLALKNALGEAVEVEFTEENTHFITDELFGSVEFVDGVPIFSAGSFDGLGKVTATVLLENETVTADLFLEVTCAVDSLTLDQNIVIADSEEVKTLTLSAKLGEKEVFFGDEITLSVDSEDIVCSLDGREVTLSLVGVEKEGSADAQTEEPPETAEEIPETAEEILEITEEDMLPEIPETELPTSASGIFTAAIGDNEISIPVFFDSELALNIGELILPQVTVENEGYTLTFDGEGGVSGEGAFIIESPIVEEIPEETTQIEQDTEISDVFEDIAEKTTEIPEKTVAETVSVEPAETAEPAEPTEPTETAEPTESTDISETSEPEETAKPEPVFEPFEVAVKAENAIVTDGLSGRRMWIWADGLSSSVLPYAVVKTENGEEILYYERFYDFLDYSGRALFTLSFEGIEGVIALDTLFAYTADAEEQKISLGSPIIARSLDTNLYADTAEHWSGYYVNALSYMGIVNGSENLYGELVYTPDGSLSREQFAKILVNYLKIDVNEYADTEIDFADTAAIAEWALPYVRAAVGAGLMRGRSTPADTVIFAPADKITRQEAIYVLGGLLSEVEGSALSFTDSESVAPWAAENLSKALTAGLISGYDDGSLRPEGSITRAEAATVVVRLYEFSSES